MDIFELEICDLGWWMFRGSGAEMETGRVDGHRLGRPAGQVTGRVEILQPAGQAG